MFLLLKKETYHFLVLSKVRIETYSLKGTEVSLKKS